VPALFAAWDHVVGSNLTNQLGVAPASPAITQLQLLTLPRGAVTVEGTSTCLSRFSLPAC